MNINEVFPSKYLKAEDLQGREIQVTISHVTVETFDDNKAKPILYFVGKQKGVALNKTNSTNISAVFGPETDHWSGKPVILYPAWVDYQGKSVQAIRVRPAFANPQQQAQQMQAPPPVVHPTVEPTLDDSVPF
jgi:hypothetical protein